MHRKAGELEPARKLFEQALTYYPAFDHALVGLARTLIALNRPAEAVPHLRAALKQNPENEVACVSARAGLPGAGNTAEQEKALAEFNRVRSLARSAPPRCRSQSAMSRRRRSTSSRRNDRYDGRGSGPAGSTAERLDVSYVRARVASPRSLTVLAIAPARASDDVTFTDVTKASGITFSHVSSPDKKYILESMSGGVALFDFDNDRLLDVYFVNSPTVASAGDPRSARSELWRNRGDGTFVDVTDKAGVGYPGWGMGAVAADFDNDGWNDLYVTCYGPNHLYRNNGDGTFSDVTEKAGVGDRRWSTGAAFADYDGDGWLDLFVANYADLRLERAARVRQREVLRVPRDPCPMRPARPARLRRLALSQQRRRHVRGGLRRRRAWRIPTGVSAWASSGAISTATDIRICSSPTMRARIFSTRIPATARSPTWPCRRDRAQRGRERAGLHGRRRRGLRPFGRLERPRHELLGRVQRTLSAGQGLPVHRCLLRLADRESQHPARRLGNALPRLRQRRLARSVWSSTAMSTRRWSGPG